MHGFTLVRKPVRTNGTQCANVRTGSPAVTKALRDRYRNGSTEGRAAPEAPIVGFSDNRSVIFYRPIRRKSGYLAHALSRACLGNGVIRPFTVPAHNQHRSSMVQRSPNPSPKPHIDAVLPRFAHFFAHAFHALQMRETTKT